ncbi:hypothetical protein BU24DRAFT_178146 [Aaosphaeria arxii CBS 175.79]|uniref:Uncharacterized protein n=1 Tax=Aaosphaeria arxii CBS 175.79 TaxID=1450172 RepID=A0A6A5XT49_9PLEO|nr:uncharacterized protein BU24DRAFT_178146 [Aaosphaeria arxii CBS 175.79]KAF2015424.1 hypothetical protein BU24DRAFT_178146 [Aaosphaeria arxii CBS 175.79]
MPARFSPQLLWRRAFASTTRARATISSPLSTIPSTNLGASSSSVPKLGKVGRWYLPTMALIAAGMIYLPANLFNSTSTSLTSTLSPSPTLDSANRKIGFAIANALEEHNHSSRRQRQQPRELTQTEKNRLLMDAYGSRSTLEDIEAAFRQIENGTASVVPDASERNRRLQEAYGGRESLRDVERAMQVYEVQ